MEIRIMKRRWKIFFAVGVFLILMAASLMVTMHVLPRNEVEAYKKLLRDKGEKLEISAVLPPPAAPEDNSANAVEDAFRMFGSGFENIPRAMQMVAPGKAMIGWRQPDARSDDFTNSWDAFGAAVEANRPAVELLHQVLQRPKLDFQLDYKKGVGILLPHLSPLKRSAQKLDAAAIYELHNGDIGAAATNILTMLALVHKNAPEGLLISHLVRTAMATIAVAPTWELLQATNVTDAQLVALQKGWEQMDFLSDAENAFVLERACTSVTIQESRNSHKGFIETFGLGWSDIPEDFAKGPRLAIAEIMWRSSWSYTAELHTLKNTQVILETIRTMETNRSQFYKADYDAMLSRLSLLGFTSRGEAFFSALKIPDFRGGFENWGMSPVIRKTLQIETARRVVITAIALKRFQLKHGQWPETLAELAPEFFQTAPLDPYDGKPLKYRPNADGTFLLYSVGEDGVDDGGDFSPVKPSPLGSLHWNWQHARDWVWPQPALPEEVQKFYEHPRK
jgi:hypothetical protein